MLLVLMTSSCQAHHATGRSTADTLTTSSTGQVEVPVGWARQEGFADNVQAVEGARLYVSSGCMACHVYAGFGNQNLGAPELTAEGTKHRGVRFQVAHLKCPSCETKGSSMPAYKGLGDAELHSLAIFLEASKGMS